MLGDGFEVEGNGDEEGHMEEDLTGCWETEGARTGAKKIL